VDGVIEANVEIDDEASLFGEGCSVRVGGLHGGVASGESGCGGVKLAVSLESSRESTLHRESVGGGGAMYVVIGSEGVVEELDGLLPALRLRAREAEVCLSFEGAEVGGAEFAFHSVEGRGESGRGVSMAAEMVENRSAFTGGPERRSGLGAKIGGHFIEDGGHFGQGLIE